MSPLTKLRDSTLYSALNSPPGTYFCTNVGWNAD